MKMLVLIEIDVPKLMGETIQRNGFELAQDGTNLQVKVANSPPIPQRKTKVVFATNPNCGINELMTHIKNLSVEAPVISESK